MLFKPNEAPDVAGKKTAPVASRARRRTVSTTITLVILGARHSAHAVRHESKPPQKRATVAKPGLPLRKGRAGTILKPWILFHNDLPRHPRVW